MNTANHTGCHVLRYRIQLPRRSCSLIYLNLVAVGFTFDNFMYVCQQFLPLCHQFVMFFLVTALWLLVSIFYLLAVLLPIVSAQIYRASSCSSLVDNFTFFSECNVVECGPSQPHRKCAQVAARFYAVCLRHLSQICRSW